MCYSLYLVHQIPIKGISAALYAAGFRSPLEALMISLPLCTVVSLLLGRLFYIAVERRFLNTPSQPVLSTREGTSRGGPIQVAV